MSVRAGLVALTSLLWGLEKSPSQVGLIFEIQKDWMMVNNLTKLKISSFQEIAFPKRIYQKV